MTSHGHITKLPEQLLNHVLNGSKTQKWSKAKEQDSWPKVMKNNRSPKKVFVFFLKKGKGTPRLY